jgi:enoyl-CoA hydratase/carnithine racemase
VPTACPNVGYSIYFQVEHLDPVCILRLVSEDGTNRLSRACVLALTSIIRDLEDEVRPLVITGNQKFFSAGAEIAEIAALSGPEAYEFSQMGQDLMNTVERFPAPVLAAVSGYCMGGGLDLALACHRRIASPHAVFGHRGAALGLMTGWGGTQRLPRLIGKAKALEILVTAEKIHASEGLRVGLVESIADNPVAEAIRQLSMQLDSQAHSGK